MTEKQYYLLKKCGNCYHYQMFRDEFKNGNKRPVIEYNCRCELYGNVNPNELCCNRHFEPKKQVLKECKEYGAVLLTKEEVLEVMGNDCII